MAVTAARRAAARPGALVLAVVVSAGLLSACGDDDSPEAGTDKTVPTAEDPTGHNNVGHDEPSPVPEGARRVSVTARSSGFEPSEIVVGSGEPIAVVLRSEDGVHDFVIDEFDAHVSADAGEIAVGGFRAHEPGRYAFYCSVAGHRDAGMEGTLVVEAHQ